MGDRFGRGQEALHIHKLARPAICIDNFLEHLGLLLDLRDHLFEALLFEFVLGRHIGRVKVDCRVELALR